MFQKNNINTRFWIITFIFLCITPILLEYPRIVNHAMQTDSIYSSGTDGQNSLIDFDSNIVFSGLPNNAKILEVNHSLISIIVFGDEGLISFDKEGSIKYRIPTIQGITFCFQISTDTILLGIKEKLYPNLWVFNITSGLIIKRFGVLQSEFFTQPLKNHYILPMSGKLIEENNQYYLLLAFDSVLIKYDINEEKIVKKIFMPVKGIEFFDVFPEFIEHKIETIIAIKYDVSSGYVICLVDYRKMKVEYMITPQKIGLNTIDGAEIMKNTGHILIYGDKIIQTEEKIIQKHIIVMDIMGRVIRNEIIPEQTLIAPLDFISSPSLILFYNKSGLLSANILPFESKTENKTIDTISPFPRYTPSAYKPSIRIERKNENFTILIGDFEVAEKNDRTHEIFVVNFTFSRLEDLKLFKIGLCSLPEYENTIPYISKISDDFSFNYLSSFGDFYKIFLDSAEKIILSRKNQDSLKHLFPAKSFEMIEIEDVDADGVKDYVYFERSNTFGSPSLEIQCFSGKNYQMLWNTQLKAEEFHYGGFRDISVISDINNDGFSDIVFLLQQVDNNNVPLNYLDYNGTSTKLRVISGFDGNIIKEINWNRRIGYENLVARIHAVHRIIQPAIGEGILIVPETRLKSNYNRTNEFLFFYVVKEDALYVKYINHSQVFNTLNAIFPYDFYCEPILDVNGDGYPELLFEGFNNESKQNYFIRLISDIKWQNNVSNIYTWDSDNISNTYDIIWQKNETQFPDELIRNPNELNLGISRLPLSTNMIKVGSNLPHLIYMYGNQSKTVNYRIQDLNNGNITNTISFSFNEKVALFTKDFNNNGWLDHVISSIDMNLRKTTFKLIDGYTGSMIKQIELYIYEKYFCIVPEMEDNQHMPIDLSQISNSRTNIFLERLNEMQDIMGINSYVSGFNYISDLSNINFFEFGDLNTDLKFNLSEYFIFQINNAFSISKFGEKNPIILKQSNSLAVYQFNFNSINAFIKEKRMILTEKNRPITIFNLDFSNVSTNSESSAILKSNIFYNIIDIKGVDNQRFWAYNVGIEGVFYDNFISFTTNPISQVIKVRKNALINNIQISFLDQNCFSRLFFFEVKPVIINIDSIIGISIILGIFVVLIKSIKRINKQKELVEYLNK